MMRVVQLLLTAPGSSQVAAPTKAMEPVAAVVVAAAAVAAPVAKVAAQVRTEDQASPVSKLLCMRCLASTLQHMFRTRMLACIA